MTIVLTDANGYPYIDEFKLPVFEPEVLGPALSLDTQATLTEEVLTDAGHFRERFPGAGGRVLWMRGWDTFCREVRERIFTKDGRSFSSVTADLSSAWESTGGEPIPWPIRSDKNWLPRQGDLRLFEEVNDLYGDSVLALGYAMNRALNESRLIAFRPMLNGFEWVPPEEWKKLVVPLPGVHVFDLRRTRAACRFLFTADLPARFRGEDQGGLRSLDQVNAEGAAFEMIKEREAQGNPWPNRATAEIDVRAATGIAGKAFNRAWDRAAPPGGRKAGRKPTVKSNI